MSIFTYIPFDSLPTAESLLFWYIVITHSCDCDMALILCLKYSHTIWMSGETSSNNLTKIIICDNFITHNFIIKNSYHITTSM